METNVLYYGDNLDVLRKYIPDASVDLVYLDPPFNSNATYNVLFKEPSGKSSEAQIAAFEDTWQWGTESAHALEEMARSPLVPNETKQFIGVLQTFVGQRTAMRAYLTMMAIRPVELRRVLKDTGSIYLHCDPTASHYLKLLMDTIFGAERFLNEITWKRTTAHNDPRRYGRIADHLLFYSRSAIKTFNAAGGFYSAEQLARYKYEDALGRYRAENLTAPHFSPTRTVEWRGTHPGVDRQ